MYFTTIYTFDIDFYQISLFNCFLQCCSPRISMQPSLGALPGLLPLSSTQRTWNSPVSLHLLPCTAIMHACTLSCFSCVQLFVTPWTVAARLLCPWGSPGKNTGVGCHTLFQRIFPTQRWNPRLLPLLHCRGILHC